jgi:hypothetical protein
VRVARGSRVCTESFVTIDNVPAETRSNDNALVTAVPAVPLVIEFADGTRLLVSTDGRLDISVT